MNLSVSKVHVTNGRMISSFLVDMATLYHFCGTADKGAGSAEVTLEAVGRLSREDREGMERLYRAYYEGADVGDFARDLDEKNWAIVLGDEKGVRGFSTMKLVRVAETNVLFASYSFGGLIVPGVLVYNRGALGMMSS